MFEKVAPRAGFEPATNRLTAGCSTAELPGTMAAHARECPAITKAFRLAKRQIIRRSSPAVPSTMVGRQARCRSSRGPACDRGRRSGAVESGEDRARNVFAPEAARRELIVRQTGKGPVEQGH